MCSGTAIFGKAFFHPGNTKVVKKSNAKKTEKELNYLTYFLENSTDL